MKELGEKNKRHKNLMWFSVQCICLHPRLH